MDTPSQIISFRPRNLYSRSDLVTKFAFENNIPLIQVPLLGVERLSLDEAEINFIRELREVDWVLLTSSNAAVVLAEIVKVSNFCCQIACVGEATKQLLESMGFTVKLVPQIEDSVSLVEELIELILRGSEASPRVIYLRGRQASSYLRLRMSEVEIAVQEILVYESLPVEPEQEAKSIICSIDKGSLLYFSNSLSVKTFVNSYQHWGLLAEKLALAEWMAIGEPTARCISQFGYSVRRLEEVEWGA